MKTAAEEMRRVSSLLRTLHNVDTDLDEVIARHGTMSSSDLAAAQGAVGDRIRALQSASEKLRQLFGTLSDLRAVAKFTPEGWDERRTELEAAFAADPMDGLASWADDWCQAAAAMRTDALDRLTNAPFRYPPGSEWLVRRLATAQRALAEGNWLLARPVLRAVAAGLRFGDRDVPAPEVQAAIFLLLARMAVAQGKEPAAELEEARNCGIDPAEIAMVRAWWARQDGRTAEAAACLADVRGNSSVPVIAEIVRQSNKPGGDYALSAARERVAGLTSASDVVSQLNRLIEPVPSQLWFAVAERATRDGDTSTARGALDQADQTVGDDYELGAAIREHRAELLAATVAAPSALADAWVAAGDYRWTAGMPEIAEMHYRRAQEIRPDDVQAALGVAGAQAAQWNAKPISESAPHLAEALESLETIQLRCGVSADTAWSLLNAADLHMKLAQAGGLGSAEHLWRSLLAVARALSIQGQAPAYWAQLANQLGEFGIYQAAVFAAKRSYEIGPGAATRDELIRAAINVNDLTTACDLIPESADPPSAWLDGATGVIKWRLGQAAEAVELLRRAARGEPALEWVRLDLIKAYLLTAAGDLAAREARQLRAYLGERRDPIALFLFAFVALIHRELDEAERLGSDLAEWESRAVDEGAGFHVQGMARLLGGRANGIAALVSAVDRTRAPGALQEWEQLDLPVLRALADAQDVDLPDLAPVTDAVRRRRIRLAAWEDPLVEMADAPAGNADPSTVRQVRVLVSLILQEASGQLERARGVLADGAGAEAGVPEWAQLAERVRSAYVDDCLKRGDLGRAAMAERERLAASTAKASAGARDVGRLIEIAQLISAAGRQDEAQHVLDAAREQAGQGAELTRAQGDVLWRRGLRTEAAKCWESARTAGADRLEARLAMYAAPADRPAATDLLRQALSRSYADTAADLCALLTKEDDIAALRAALEDTGTAPETEVGALVTIGMLAALPEPLELPEHALEVHLPPSWFEGISDPLTEHPLLARYIPEVRLRWAGTLPGVRVCDDAELMPDGFRVIILGLIAYQGTVVRGDDYVSEDALPLLSASTRERLKEGPEPGLLALRSADDQAAGGLDTLLLRPAAEIVAGHIERIATTYHQVLEQYGEHISGA